MGPSNTSDHTTEDNLAAATLASTLSLANAFSEEVVSLSKIPAGNVFSSKSRTTFMTHR